MQSRVSAHGHHPVAGLQTGSVGQGIRKYKRRLADYTSSRRDTLIEVLGFHPSGSLLSLDITLKPKYGSE